MIPLTFLCDEYTDRPKLSEQKKPFEYIVPPPTRGVGTFMVGVTENQRHPETTYRVKKLQNSKKKY